MSDSDRAPVPTGTSLPRSTSPAVAMPALPVTPQLSDAEARLARLIPDRASIRRRIFSALMRDVIHGNKPA